MSDDDRRVVSIQNLDEQPLFMGFDTNGPIVAAREPGAPGLRVREHIGHPDPNGGFNVVLTHRPLRPGSLVISGVPWFLGGRHICVVDDGTGNVGGPPHTYPFGRIDYATGQLEMAGWDHTVNLQAEYVRNPIRLQPSNQTLQELQRLVDALDRAAPVASETPGTWCGRPAILRADGVHYFEGGKWHGPVSRPLISDVDFTPSSHTEAKNDASPPPDPAAPVPRRFDL
jgi:hypothetical protein